MKNPYLLANMKRVNSNSFAMTFFNDNFGNCYFNYVYGPNEKVNFYHETGEEVTVKVATWLRDAMNRVFNEVD